MGLRALGLSTYVIGFVVPKYVYNTGTAMVLPITLYGSNSDHDLPIEKSFGPPKVGFQASTK